MPVEWTEARIYKLVLSYIRHECLWKHDSDSYNDLEARYTAYLGILQDLNIRDLTVNEVRDRIKQIKRAYRMELAKINDANFRGFPYKPKTTWFELLHEFLRVYITDQDSNTDSLLHVEANNGEPEEFNYHGSQSLLCSQRRCAINQCPSCVRYFPTQPGLDTCPTKLTKYAAPLEKKINLSSQHDFITQQTPGALQSTPNISSFSTSGDCPINRIPDAEIQSHFVTNSVKKHKSQKKYGDEFDAFGKSVACQLRELSLPHALRTQTKIQNLLAEERINSNKEKVISNQSEKEATQRHRHHRDSRWTQPSRSNHSSFICNANFRCPSASDSSFSGHPSNARHTKLVERNQTVNCHPDNCIASKISYKKASLKT
ncbi:uncharacterized protein LOC124414565 [Diprion similis]|uniref:uncharacterized protein LOC124414565 n=1 Tax=Diprion similis TaxID=362088 RepID=UPI001EF904D8|nr:uncharacterized protein LOC124414565 [Diprion similis]